jgi:hypothetical protein
MVKRNNNEEELCLSLCRDVFKGHVLAARWWHKYHRGPFDRKIIPEDEMEVPIRTAMEELVRYTIESLPGVERFMEPEEVLTMGFKMGMSFQQALAAGELECEGDTEVEVPFPPSRESKKKFDLESLFSPHCPDNAH